MACFENMKKLRPRKPNGSYLSKILVEGCHHKLLRSTARLLGVIKQIIAGNVIALHDAADVTKIDVSNAGPGVCLSRYTDSETQ
jgi:hypothetical protein